MDVKVDGRCVRVLREESLRTRAEIASLAGIAESTIAKIETGKDIVRMATARKLAQALKVEPKVFATPLTRSGVRLGKVVSLRALPNELLREGTN